MLDRNIHVKNGNVYKRRTKFELELQKVLTAKEQDIKVMSFNIRHKQIKYVNEPKKEMGEMIEFSKRLVPVYHISSSAKQK